MGSDRSSRIGAIRRRVLLREAAQWPSSPNPDTSWRSTTARTCSTCSSSCSEEEGYRVSTLIYADRDLPKIASSDLDLIILDYQWATEDDGWTLLQMLRMNRATAAIPIILCTGAVSHVRETEGHLQTMGVDVIFKPFAIDPLLQLIQEVLARRVPSAEPPDSPDTDQLEGEAGE